MGRSDPADADVGTATADHREERIGLRLNRVDDLRARPAPALPAEVGDALVGAFAIGLVDAGDLNGVESPRFDIHIPSIRMVYGCLDA